MTQKTLNNIFIITGEASGDVLASQLATELLRLQPDLKIRAMGGERLKQVGADVIVDSTHLGIIGFGEVVPQLKAIFNAFSCIKKSLKQEKPDLIILVDYPGFNLRVAGMAKSLGIPVFYYVSPQIWAWRYGRIKKIRETVSHMAVLFPFEADMYQRENVPVTFVGHPLVSASLTTLAKETVCQYWDLNPEQPIIGLFPGSRRQEIHRLLPIMMESLPLIRKKIPAAQFVLPLANNLSEADVAPYINDSVTLIQNHTRDIIPICDAAIAVSGTITLEIALQAVPLLIIYKVSLFSAIFIGMLLRAKNIGLCNVVAEERIAQEFLQWKVTAESIANETIKMLSDQPYRTTMIQKLKSIKTKLTIEDATATNTAKAVLSTGF